MKPYEKAQSGLTQIKQAICDFVRSHPEGVSHADICRQLGLESDFEGRLKNCLSWSVLGLLLKEDRVIHKGHGQRRIYFTKN